MIRISDAIDEIVEAHASLRFGFYHGLLNLTRVAKYLKPAIEARTKKEVTESAILMNLSRRQKRLTSRPTVASDRLVLDNISIQSGLAAVTVVKSHKSHSDLNRVFDRIQSRGGFITVTEGLKEVTVMVASENVERVLTAIRSTPTNLRRDLASVSVTFDKRYLEVKGILHQILEEVALQDINIFELTSTATEFSVFLHESDVQLAFDAIFNRFSRRGTRPRT